ncbi:MAG: phage Gp37/Gp68 family protein [Desulfovibrio sp.]
MHKISWLNGDRKGETWNPHVGCSKTSPGCSHCYAETMAVRLAAMPATRDLYGQVVEWKCEHREEGEYNTFGARAKGWNGKTAFSETALVKPLSWKKPRTVFVCSMSDLFHESVPDEWIDRIYAVMTLCPQHRFIVLTKRSKRMREYMSSTRDFTDARKRLGLGIASGIQICSTPWSLPNVAHMVTAENQEMADERIPDLLATPSALRGVSIEPMLAGVDLTEIYDEDYTHFCALTGWKSDSVDTYSTNKLDLVICGGESGQGARPMHPDWARSLRDQCAAAGVPFHFKQWGKYLPRDVTGQIKFNGTYVPAGNDSFSKKYMRLLDGREHNGTFRWPDA